MPHEFTTSDQLTENLKQQSSDVALHSPLEIVGAFVYILRELFVSSAPRWPWENNRNTTNIFIEAGGQEALEAGNNKPSLFVNRGQTIYERVSLGDLDQDQPQLMEKGLRHFYAYGRSDISVECISPSRGESALLGDTVQQFIHMSSNEIQQYFNFHSISPVILNQTQPFDKDIHYYNTSVMFRVSFEVRWATIPIRPALKNIGLKLQESGGAGLLDVVIT